MNQEQLTSLFRTVSQIGGSLLAANGYGTSTQWETVSGTLLTLGMTAWSIYSNRTASLIAKAGSHPDVQPIPVTNPALAAAANKAAGTTVAVAA